MIPLLTAAILGILIQSPMPYLRLQVAPTESGPAKFAQVGLAVFDVCVNEGGSVVNDVPLYGQPPFIERSHLSINEWQFKPGTKDGAHINAIFLYKPTLNLPDLPSVLDVPLPDSYEELRSPFPVTIFDPGYPIEGASDGAVVMQVIITPEGGVGDIQVLNAVPTLTNAAVTAVRRWKFYLPLNRDRLSQTAVVAIYFNEPKLSAPPPDGVPTAVDIATLVSGTALAAPIGAEGTVRTDDPSGLVFVYGNSHWVVPAALISRIELVELPSQQNLIKITFSGAQNEEMVTFSLIKQAALSLATALSARTGKIIHFKGGPIS